jgi:hypothetical protein
MLLGDCRWAYSDRDATIVETRAWDMLGGELASMPVRNQDFATIMH